MKTKHIIFSLLAVFAFASALFFNACKKDVVSEPIAQSTQISQEDIEASKAMSEHIKAFKQRMNYCKQNPSFKSGTFYLPGDAVLEVEAALSFTYCFSNIDIKEQEFTSSTLIMPLENGEIAENDLSIFQEDVINALQGHMLALAYPDKKLMVVDLEYLGNDANGDAIVGITSVVGNQQAVFLHDDAWWYGLEAGNCQGYYAPEDASTQLQQRVIDELLPPPPSSGRWFFTNPISITYYYYQYPLTPQGEDPDNYCDYRIFFADNNPSQNLEITDTEKCLSHTEMVFYEGHYVDLAIDYENANGNRKFKTCIVEDITSGPEYSPDQIKHDYTVSIGFRFVEYFDGVGDIMNPN
jgi:hypothetical protein